MTRKGTLFILFGPSGVGKTTLAQALIAHFKGRLIMVRSYTTRSVRKHEQHGVDYWFISPEEFEQKKQKQFFLEYSTAYKASYGSSYKDVMDMLEAGQSVLMVIDRSGVEQVMQRVPQAIAIQILPPSLEVLRERLAQRGDLGQQELEFRIHQSQKELAAEAAHSLARFVVVNDDLEAALSKISEIIEDCF